jgi:hypothetical protein
LGQSHIRKDKAMENVQASLPSPAQPSTAPEVIFANWWETLLLLKLYLRAYRDTGTGARTFLSIAVNFT